MEVLRAHADDRRAAGSVVQLVHRIPGVVLRPPPVSAADQQAHATGKATDHPHEPLELGVKVRSVAVRRDVHGCELLSEASRVLRRKPSFVREETGADLGFLSGVERQAAWNDHGVVGILDEAKVQDRVCQLPKALAVVVWPRHVPRAANFCSLGCERANGRGFYGAALYTRLYAGPVVELLDPGG